MQLEEEGPVNYEKIIAQILEGKPWEGRIATKDSEAEKLIKTCKGTFDKYQQSLLGMFSQIA